MEKNHFNLRYLSLLALSIISILLLILYFVAKWILSFRFEIAFNHGYTYLPC